MSSRALLNSFMLCPRLRAKSGNFFAPKRTRTMRRIINRSGPPRFPIPNASIFITILNWLGFMFYSSRSAYICFKMLGSLLYDLEPDAPSRTRFASPLVRFHCLRPAASLMKKRRSPLTRLLSSISCGLWEETHAHPFGRRRQDCCMSRSTKALRSSAFTSETAQNTNPSRSQCQTL
jgi:hypothetical protein